MTDETTTTPPSTDETTTTPPSTDETLVPDLDALRALSIDKMGAAIGGLGLQTLIALRDLELAQGAGKTRKGAVEMLDAAIVAAHPADIKDSAAVDLWVLELLDERNDAVAPPMVIERRDLRPSSGGILLARTIDVDGSNPPGMIAKAVLKEVSRAVEPEGYPPYFTGSCTIPGGLPCGGGRHAQMPADSLIFN